jgi:D-alanyl-D-alanine carboxypeptidase (penicillin-binding protein 5/6)
MKANFVCSGSVFLFLVFFFFPFTSFASAPPEIGSKAAVLLDAATGTELFTKNPDEKIPPASLTKLMTMHLAFKAIAAGTLSLATEITPPRASWAANQPPRSSLMFLGPGQIVTLRELLLGLAIPSGNDAADAVALEIAPSIPAFADMMNQEAARMGLMNLHWVEPSGISEKNMITARDFAKFCRVYVEEHPEALNEFHSVHELAYPQAANVAPRYKNRPGTIVQYNHNNLLGKVEGVDGLKTGYIDEAGYNIALTARRKVDGCDTRFVAVLLGAPARPGGAAIRDKDGEDLLEWAFANYKTVRPVEPVIPDARIWKGKKKTLALKTDGSLVFTANVTRAKRLFTNVTLNEPLVAPVVAGQKVGTLTFYDEYGNLKTVAVAAAESVALGGFWTRLVDSISLFFRAKDSK